MLHSMAQTATEQPGLFQGVYSYREAARLLQVPSRRVARWADGYSFQLKYGQGHSRPVLQTERYQGVISFRELMELFFVREYTAMKVNLKHIRATAEALAQQLGPYPFSRADLLVSGSELLIRNAEGYLQRPDIGQLVADFAATFAKLVEIREEQARRYSPVNFDGKVYLDAEIRGGEAVVTQFAVPTRVIYNLWEKEHDLAIVADYHDISLEDVSIAVRYEGQWRLVA